MVERTQREPTAPRRERKNELGAATSPYLRQHGDNPVHWHQWGPEALQRAKQEDKPILLSVGYSACHWCHVMAHESFEDPATAAVMNEHFINIKVDREERPDIDAVYQKVVQLMGQGGGWPLTVFLTPEQKPFYGGTYFPSEPRYGRPSFGQVLQTLQRIYRDKPEEVQRQTQAFMDGFQQISTILQEDARTSDGPDLATVDALRQAAQRLVTRIDSDWGGFGTAPKFPNPTALEILLRVARAGEQDGLARTSGAGVRLTLEQMWRGGIYDHLRGGFARYSVDRMWLVPHFEKMLYDNAQLLPLYAEAGALWPDAHLRTVARETIEYLVADMRTDDGLFHAASDADSEGVEGKYFCWTPAQIREVLEPELADLFCRAHGVTEQGNFEHGWSVLHRPHPLGELAKQLGTTRAELEPRLSEARERLLQARHRRIAPEVDTKILTSWNALLVTGLARTAGAARAWGDPELAERSHKLAHLACSRLLTDHIDDRGRVYRAAFQGQVHTRGYLDDVAYLARACLDLHEISLEPELVDRAHALASHALEHYVRDDGGFYFTADDGEPLIERIESQHDAAVPAGGSVMMEVLLRLEHHGQLPEGGRAVIDATLDRFSGSVAHPFAYASMLTAATRVAEYATHVTLSGPEPFAPEVDMLAQAVRTARLKLPHAVSLGFVAGERVQAVVCRGQVCTTPLHDVAALERALAE